MAKISDTAVINSIRLKEQASAPDTPASGYGQVYIKTDGKPYFKDDAGNETDLSKAYAEGTEFPASPTTNDKFYRTDRNLLYYYDGTRWLTTTLFNVAPGASTSPAAVTVSTDVARWPVTTADGGMYLVSLKAAVHIATTNNGSHYWTIKLIRAAADNTAADVVSANTSADTISTWYEKTLAINAVLDSTARALKGRVETSGSPGAITSTMILYYRLIG